MLTQGKIDKFYKDVDALALKKKNAEIQRATGFSKSNVSEWLNKKKTPSENFINVFYEKFESMLAKGSTNGAQTGIESSYMKLLEDNDRFFKNEYAQMLLSLRELIGLSRQQEALLKLNLQHVGAVEALQRGVEPEVIQEQINIQIADMGASEETGSDADSHGKP